VSTRAFAGSTDDMPAKPVSAFPQTEADRLADSVTATGNSGAILTMEEALLHTLVYADLFDYPLTVQEVHRYLTGRSASLSTVDDYLRRNSPLGRRLGFISPFWFLGGREHLVGLRQEREVVSQALWRGARRYGRLVAAIPFVRMVAITGSLAMNNASSKRDDVDFLIVSAQHRLWLSRGLVILIVHLARLQGLELCPNYVIAEHCLQLSECNLFTAHELAQIVPLHGLRTYRRLLESNSWLSDYLPNATPHSAGAGEIGGMARRGQQFMEAVLAGRVGDAVERWESGRKISRLRRTAQQRGAEGAIYTPDLCKGHVDDHASDVRQRYAEGLAAQGVQPARAWGSG
jgi:hypothetical protein